MGRLVRNLASLALLVALSGCTIDRSWRESSAASTTLRLSGGPGPREASLDDLCEGLFDEPLTRRLLERLHPGVPIEVARVASSDVVHTLDAVQAPPSRRDTVAFRVAFLGSRAEEPGGRVIRVAAGRTTVLSGDRAPERPQDFDRAVEQLASVPSAIATVALCLEDALLRRESGWAVVDPAAGRPPGDVAARRVELERRIAEHARRFARLVAREE